MKTNANKTIGLIIIAAIIFGAIQYYNSNTPAIQTQNAQTISEFETSFIAACDPNASLYEYNVCACVAEYIVTHDSASEIDSLASDTSFSNNSSIPAPIQEAISACVN